MARSRSRRVLLWLAIPVILFVALFAWWVNNAGSYLVDSRPPQPADAVLVLAGGLRGDRVVKAGELVRSGYAPVALVSGPYEIYGQNEADLAIHYAVAQGFPASLFTPLYNHALSTREEADYLVPELRKRKLHKVLLVTTSYHTRRAREVFSRAASEIQFVPVASNDPYFTPHGWWKTREGQKTMFFEWSKTVASALGL